METGRFVPQEYAGYQASAAEVPLTEAEHERGVRRLQRLFAKAHQMGLRSNEAGLVV